MKAKQRRSYMFLFSFLAFFPGSAYAAATISAVEARQVRDTSAIILWRNEVPGTIPAPLAGQVEYGLTPSYGNQTSMDNYSFFHSLTLTALAPAALYHYRLRVQDKQTIETYSEDYTFTTLSTPIPQSISGISPNPTGDTIINEDTTWQGITATCGGNITAGNASKRILFTIKDSTVTVQGLWTMGGNQPVDFSLINSTVILDAQGGAPDLINGGYIDGSKMIVVNDTLDSGKASSIELLDSLIRGTDAAYKAGGVVIKSGYTGYAASVTQHRVIIDNTRFAYMGGLTHTGAGYWALNLRWWDGYTSELAEGSVLTHISLIHAGKGIRMGGEMKLDYAYAAGGACAFTDGKNYEHLYMNQVYEGLYEPDDGALVNHSWFDGHGTKFNFNTGSNGVFEYNYVQNAAFNAGDGGGNNNIVRNNVLYHTGIGSRKDYTQYLNNQIDGSGFEFIVSMGGLHQTASGNTITGTTGKYGLYVAPHEYTTLPAGWHTIRDNIINGTQYGMLIGKGVSNSAGTLRETHNKFINNAILGTCVGWGILLQDTANQLFINTKISNTATRDIQLMGNNANLKFINTQFDPDKVYLNDFTDVFLPYCYLDVKVLDNAGHPVAGTKVTVTNEINNALYPACNINGENRSTATTDTLGYTPLPSDASNSLAIIDYAQTKAGKTEMSYAVIAEKNGVRASVNGVNPDASWYRENPDVHAKTITIALPANAAMLDSFDKIIVAPNPYVKKKSPGAKIIFGNLPEMSAVRIYTASGALIKILQHEETSAGGSEAWDVAEAAEGVYLYTVTSPRRISRGKVSVIK